MVCAFPRGPPLAVPGSAGGWLRAQTSWGGCQAVAMGCARRHARVAAASSCHGLLPALCVDCHGPGVHSLCQKRPDGIPATVTCILAATPDLTCLPEGGGAVRLYLDSSPADGAGNQPPLPDVASSPRASEPTDSTRTPARSVANWRVSRSSGRRAAAVVTTELPSARRTIA